MCAPSKWWIWHVQSVFTNRPTTLGKSDLEYGNRKIDCPHHDLKTQLKQNHTRYLLISRFKFESHNFFRLSTFHVSSVGGSHVGEKSNLMYMLAQKTYKVMWVPQSVWCYWLPIHSSKWRLGGHFTHETESPWPLHFKHSYWWERRSWSKFAELRSRDQRSMWMQDGCKVYMDSYMALNGIMFHGHLDYFSKTISWR